MEILLNKYYVCVAGIKEKKHITYLIADLINMAEEGAFYKAVFILGVTFTAGFVAGYKAKEFRLEWLKRRRERLAVKLQETQKEIEAMKAH